MRLKTCHEILVLELIGDCYIHSRQRVGSVHYRFKLPVEHYLEIFIAATLDVDRRLNASLETDSVCHMTVIQETRL